MSNTHLILHVKGTEQETTTLPKQVVRAAILQGQITHSQLIWSPEDNAWKQVRELPHLLPSQKLAPAPTPRLGTGALPKVEGVPQPRIGTGALPKVKAAPQAGATPQVAVKASAQTPRMMAAVAKPAAATGYSDDGEHHEFNLFKWICIVLSIVILGAVGFNFVMVDQPLMEKLGKTSYRNVTVYAHLGAFMQPNVLLIHVPPSSQVTDANLVDFLTTLARSTPRSPVSDVLFDRVALTPGWTGLYAFSGSDWKQLGEMQDATEAERKMFILEKMTDPAGQSLVSSHSSLNEEARQAEREKVWMPFVAAFTGK
jgi:hypothetical protein